MAEQRDNEYPVVGKDDRRVIWGHILTYNPDMAAFILELREVFGNIGLDSYEVLNDRTE
jgi:hypothetical protein